MSREEKRAKLLQVFHEGQGFYQLKEVEKLAKEKNLNQNQVKEILQALADEELVDSEKFGSTIFFWSFPNKALKTQRKKREELRATKKEEEDKLVTLETALKAEQVRNCVNNESECSAQVDASIHIRFAGNTKWFR